jgi:hypothetical protein
VLLLLAALPSAAAAAAPTGFAATPYGCRNSAFARGPCFGLGAGRGSPFSSLGDFPGTEADRLDLALALTEAAGNGGSPEDITKEEDSSINFWGKFCNIPPNLDRD